MLVRSNFIVPEKPSIHNNPVAGATTLKQVAADAARQAADDAGVILQAAQRHSGRVGVLALGLQGISIARILQARQILEREGHQLYRSGPWLWVQTPRRRRRHSPEGRN